MSTTHKTDRTVTRSIPAKKQSGGVRGNMKPTEIKPLVFAARRAYDRQTAAGVIDQDFDAWRKQQVLDCVGKSGLSACNHEDFRPLMAHFQILAGEDARAFSNLMQSGKASDHAEPGDTHEARRQLAHGIAAIIADHMHLAQSSIDQLVAESADAWYRTNSTEYPGPDPEWISSLQSRKAAISSHGKGPITVGYLIYIARQKTRRPDLSLGRDWQAGLAERCSARQLTEIRSTIVNRINAVEGLGSASTRNKTQRSPKSRVDRSVGTLAQRPGVDFI